MPCRPGRWQAPTAGLHFTDTLLAEIRARGVKICFVTLHVGLGTFAPVKSEMLAGHVMHEERYEVAEEIAATVNEAKRAGGRVIAVGTTSVRVLESVAAQNDGRLIAGRGRTRIFIHPPWSFRIVDGLLTNFHLLPLHAADARQRLRFAPRRNPRHAKMVLLPTPKPCANATASSATATRCCWCEDNNV